MKLQSLIVVFIFSFFSAFKGILQKRNYGSQLHIRDQRKAEAIVLHDRGLDANEFAKELGILSRSVNRYLKNG